MPDNYLAKLKALQEVTSEQEKSDSGDFKKVEEAAKENKKRRQTLSTKIKQQKILFRGKIFRLVWWLTVISFTVVVTIILSEIVDYEFPFGVKFVSLEIEKFTVLFTGFLAQMILLPKIISSGLFKYDKEE